MDLLLELTPLHFSLLVFSGSVTFVNEILARWGSVLFAVFG